MAKTRRKAPTLKDQVFRIAKNVSLILANQKNLETKEDAQRKHLQLGQRIDHLRAEMATKDDMKLVRNELKATKDELKADMKEMSDHFHGMFERHGNSHRKIEDKLNDHEKRISAVESVG